MGPPLRAATVATGYLLSAAGLLPGLLVVVRHGYAEPVGAWLWLAVPASLAGAAVMLHLTLLARDRVPDKGER